MHSRPPFAALALPVALACAPTAADDSPEPGTTSADAPGATGDGVDDGADDDGADDDGTGDTGAVTPDPDARPNWHEDVAPLVAGHCRGCHSEGGIAFAMTDHEATSPWAGLMALETELGNMPPWHAVETDECEPPYEFAHDARLDPAQIEMLKTWADLGAPEGDPAKAAPLPPEMSLDLSDPSVVVTMQSPVTIERDGDTLDYFHCLSFDPGLEGEVFIDGLQVVPGNRAIVHHVLIYADESAESAAWPGGISPDCGGGAGIPSARLIGGWVPGGLPMEPPPGVGIRFPAGARIVFNVHYHASVEGPETDDGTGIALRYTTTPPEWVSQFNLVGAPGDGASTTGEFRIPADEANHEETIEWTVPATGGAEVRMWAIGHHMHKVGVDQRTTILRDGTEHCLLQTPRWDFDWQRFYEVDAPIDEGFLLQAGDVVRVRCTYDNTTDNPSVVEALDELDLDAPQTVVLGEETLDEMCLAGFGVAIRP